MMPIPNIALPVAVNELSQAVNLKVCTIILAVGIGIGVLAINSLPFATHTEVINSSELTALRITADEAHTLVLENQQTDVLKRLSQIELGIARIETELRDRQMQKPPGG